jgi:hypothetical protein
MGFDRESQKGARMTVKPTPSNNEVGQIWTAYIVGELYELWPRRRDFNSMDVSVATGDEPREDPEEFFDDLIMWMKDNNLVRFGQATEGCAFGVALTEKGFDVLGRHAPGIDRPLGTKLKEAATGAGKDAGRAVIASLVGAMVGGAIGALTKG